MIRKLAALSAGLMLIVGTGSMAVFPLGAPPGADPVAAVQAERLAILQEQWREAKLAERTTRLEEQYSGISELLKAIFGVVVTCLGSGLSAALYLARASRRIRRNLHHQANMMQGLAVLADRVDAMELDVQELKPQVAEMQDLLDGLPCRRKTACPGAFKANGSPIPSPLEIT